MKIRIITLIFLSLALLSARAFSSDLGLVRMGIVQGDVQIYSEDAKAWVPAAVNTPLTQGDRVWVPEGGRSELQVLGGLFIRLDDSTAFDILTLGDNAYQFYLNSGRAYVNNRSTQLEELLIDTPVSSIHCYETSTVRIDVEENGATEISVLNGYAYAETKEGRIRIPSGNTLSIGEDLRTEMYPLNAPDEWEEWNRDLDQNISEYDNSNRYLPEELDTYSYDFDTNGSWLYDNSYGYVWTPAISVSLDWAPYHDGRWVWVGGNYVWISYERWGWVPYHYGRWIFLRHGGWCWVPPRRGAVYWGPGYVGWVYTPNYVSWIPLAPGETYYGHGYYGPDSVNINNLADKNFSARRNYLNRNARNAIEVIHRDTFLRGRHVAVPPRENPFNEKNVGIGPPRFKPDRETYSPILKKVPAAKLPPQRIRDLSPATLLKERISIPDRRRPVVNPTGPTREQPSPSRETPKRIIREQRPDIYTDGLPNRERRQPKQNGQVRRELPVEQNPTLPIITTPTPKRTTEKGTSTGSWQQRQPATFKGMPQPAAPQRRQPATIRVAPQPVAPQPVWTPSKPRLQEQGRSPAPQLLKRAPVTIQRAIPAPPQAPAPATQPWQLQKAPQQYIRQSPQINRQTPPQTFRQGAQPVQQQQPATVKPFVQQPQSPTTSPTITPEFQQQRGNFGERPTFQRGEGKGVNR